MKFKALYIYPESEFETDLLKLFGLIESFPEIGNDWFFIRYVDAVGVHIRFRVRECFAEKVFPVLAAHFRHTAEEVYEPETERYGGTENLKICEAAFNFSGRLVSSCYRDLEAFSYEHRLLFALVVNRLIYAQNLKEDWITKTNRTFYLMWMHYAMKLMGETEEGAMRQYYEKGYLKIRDDLPEQMQEVESYLLEVFPAELFRVHLTGLPDEKKSDVVNSLIHMSYNRFGIGNIDEAFLAYILAQTPSVKYGN
jgi:thiopeptide-type bacteriocin biosynthesis protein